jgi:hypothetical protein
MDDAPLSDAARQLRRLLISLAVGDVERATAVTALVTDRPAAEAAAILVEVGRTLPADLLGWGVFPYLRRWLGTDEGFGTGLRLLGGAEAGEPFRIILLDVLDAAARSSGRSAELAAELRRLAETPVEPARLRARAIRLLARDGSPETRDTLTTVMTGPVVDLAHEAAHSLAELSVAGQGEPPDLTRLFERMRPDRPSVPLLRALARSNRDDPAATGAAQMISRLAEGTSSPEARARLVAAAGELMDAPTLARVVTAIAENPTDDQRWALGGLLGTAPSRLLRLHDEGQVAAFVEAAALVADLSNPQIEQRLVAVVEGDDAGLAARAVALVDPAALSPEHRLVRVTGIDPVPLERLQQRLGPAGTTWPNGDPDPDPHPGPPPPTGLPFSTGFHLADGLYRDLIIPAVIAGTHWHAGLYLGFTADSPGPGDGRLAGINASQGALGISDTMAYFGASGSFASPAADVAGIIRRLRADLVIAFQEGHLDKTFQGARRPIGVTAPQRLAIAATGAALLAKNIWWTWVDMLDYKWFDWDGTVDDIDETRCDGVVEYAYEKNGVRVCGGTDPARWNIALPGTEYPENHNNYHNGNYQAGELCPRIQAGDQGDASHVGAADTSFVSATVMPPAIADFAVHPYAFIFVPSIWFRVLAPDYLTCLVRITVAKDNGSWHFVRTDDPYNGSAPPALVGNWRFKQIRTNTTDRLFGWWIGATEDGTDFFGQDGTYVFRLVAVDPAGNVSELAKTSVQIDWP